MIARKKLLLLFFFGGILFIITACHHADNSDAVNDNVHTFYYAWYENPETDGNYAHWNHSVLPHWSDTTWNHAGSFVGGDDIGADFYPESGCYSSNDTALIFKHFEMIRAAGIGTVALSWSGKNKNGDVSLPLYLAIAQKKGLKILLHIEPEYKTAAEFRANLEYIFDRYAAHPAFYRYHNKSFFYVYDSYKLPIEEWQKLLTCDGELTIRNTPLDGFYLGLWVEEDEQRFFTETGFDGFYTYFASSGFVYGSTPEHWPQMADFAQNNQLIFVPCVGPGYSDTRIRPWNRHNQRERQKGKYYEEMFRAAAAVHPKIIGITSFNEWHEGTQIEPAIAKRIENFTYKDYEGLPPQFYINKTKELILETTEAIKDKNF
ncbi:MAG: glycoside hydrolase family 99 protein [Bacteroidales bacterium]|nr:glycoside hydrolase family 99 protein [Bacteroidales bacterium]